MENQNNKLTSCAISRTKGLLVDVISKKSDKYGDKLVDFMEKYNVSGLSEASVDQLHDYIMTYCYGQQTNDLQK